EAGRCHDAEGRAERRPTMERRGSHQHWRNHVPRTTHLKRIEAGPQAGPERHADPENRRPHQSGRLADYTSCTGLAPQRGARPTLPKSSNSTTSSLAFSWFIPSRISAITSP